MATTSTMIGTTLKKAKRQQAQRRDVKSPSRRVNGVPTSGPSIAARARAVLVMTMTRYYQG